MFVDTSSLYDDTIVLSLIRVNEVNKRLKWVGSYEFAVKLIDGTIIGECELLIGHNEDTYLTGNISYSINKDFQGNGYATRVCRILYKLAKNHNLNYVIITCDPNNIASKRTCEKSGALYLEKLNIPVHHYLYSDSNKELLIYRYNL